MANSDKQLTAKQVATALLSKVGEILQKSELVKAETGHVKGVHKPFNHPEHGGLGTSLAGASNASGDYGEQIGKPSAVSEHRRVLGELKGMPKPNLPKSEDMEKCDTCGGMHKSEDAEIRELQKHGLSPEQIKAKMKKSELEKHGLSPAEIKAKMKKSEELAKTGINEQGSWGHKGVSGAGQNVRMANQYKKIIGGKSMAENYKGTAKDNHQDTIDDLKTMPAPKLGKSDHEGRKGMNKSEDIDLQIELENLSSILGEDIEKAEGYKPQNSKKENAKPSEHNSKDAMQHADGPGPKGEIHPKEKEAGDPTNETRPTPGPGNNPKENAEGNNELAGTTPTQVGQDGKNKPGYDEMKGHLKLAKFIGRMEHKRSTKDITGAQAQSESTAQHKEVVGSK
jgi:hypothetical protein